MLFRSGEVGGSLPCSSACRVLFVSRARPASIPVRPHDPLHSPAGVRAVWRVAACALARRWGWASAAVAPRLYCRRL